MSIPRPGHWLSGSDRATHLQRRPGEELQPYEGVEQLGQTEADVRILVGRVVSRTPGFELGFDAVDRAEALQDVFEHLAGLL